MGQHSIVFQWSNMFSGIRMYQLSARSVVLPSVFRKQNAVKHGLTSTESNEEALEVIGWYLRSRNLSRNIYKLPARFVLLMFIFLTLIVFCDVHMFLK